MLDKTVISSNLFNLLFLIYFATLTKIDFFLSNFLAKSRNEKYFCTTFCKPFLTFTLIQPFIFFTVLLFLSLKDWHCRIKKSLRSMAEETRFCKIAEKWQSSQAHSPAASFIQNRNAPRGRNSVLLFEVFLPVPWENNRIKRAFFENR